MKYIITESQWVNYIRRRLTPELYFEYVKEACAEYPMRGVNLDQFLEDIHTIATDDIFIKGEGDSEGLFNEEIYDFTKGMLTGSLGGKIYDYVLNYYYDNKIGEEYNYSSI